MRLMLKNEKVVFEVQANEVSSSNNEELLKIEDRFVISATLNMVVSFDPPSFGVRVELRTISKRFPGGKPEISNLFF